MYTSYRKHRFRSSFLSSLFQVWERLQRKRGELRTRLNSWGHQTISVMFIPHSEKKMLNIKLSKYTITLFLLILITITSFALVALNQSESSHTRLETLSHTTRYHEQRISLIRKGTDLTLRSFYVFRKQMERLMEQVGGKNKQTVFPELSGKDLATSLQTLRHKLENKQVHETRELRTLEILDRNISLSRIQVQRINRFISAVRDAHRHIPTLWPVTGGGRVVSPFGMRKSPITWGYEMHPGVDIVWWPGSPIRATADGTVVAAHSMGGYGLCVLVKHGYGFETRYAHLQRFAVQTGGSVKKGQVIGYMGSTGLSLAYHLHYEIIYQGTPVDPLPYLAPPF